jgi:hypothetical protein
MADEGRWVVAPDEARIEIAVGPEAKLTPELAEALENLARAVEQQQEVQGYTVCDKVHIGECRMLLICSSVRN